MVNYRNFVGPEQLYDVMGATQFNLLTLLGLRENHYLLDVGCGSLRAGRLLIQYLKPEHYYGVDPNSWLIKDAVIEELSEELIDLKKPVFSYRSDFKLSSLNRKFDFVVAQSIFSHSSKSQIESCMNEARKVLKENGVFLATYFIGFEDYAGSKWIYPGLVSYKKETFDELAMSAGFKLIYVNWFHPCGQTWVIMI